MCISYPGITIMNPSRMTRLTLSARNSPMQESPCLSLSAMLEAGRCTSYQDTAFVLCIDRRRGERQEGGGAGRTMFLSCPVLSLTAPRATLTTPTIGAARLQRIPSTTCPGHQYKYLVGVSHTSTYSPSPHDVVDNKMNLLPPPCIRFVGRLLRG